MGIQTLATSQAEGGYLGVKALVGSGSGNYTSASTSYVSVDATNLSYSIPVANGFVLNISACGVITSLTAAVTVGVAIAIDGTVVTEQQITPGAAAQQIGFGLQYVFVGDGVSHTVTLRFKTTNGSDSVSIINNSATHRPSLNVELTQSNL